jgi:hypothetical protein
MTWPYPIRLDRRLSLTGSYNAGLNRTTWTLPFTDSTINAVVLGSSFGSSEGTVLTPTNTGTTVYVTGDYSAGACVVGRTFTMAVSLSRPYVRDQNGNAHADAYCQIRKLTAFHARTGAYSLKSVQTSRANRTKSLSATGSTRATGELEAWLNGCTQNTTFSIESASARPCTIVSIQYDLDYSTRRG